MELGESTDSSVVGGKAANLGKLIQAGFDVPSGCIWLPDDNPFNQADGLWAVRSSGIAEDGDKYSYAGVHKTILNCPYYKVSAALLQCAWSGDSKLAKAYRERSGLTQMEIAVIVQEMVDAQISGIMFTANPVTGASETVIEAIYGLGEALVAGGTPNANLSLLAWEKLLTVGTEIEELFGCPQDIEWSFDQAGKLWILQSRPITTLGDG